MNNQGCICVLRLNLTLISITCIQSGQKKYRSHVKQRWKECNHNLYRINQRAFFVSLHYKTAPSKGFIKTEDVLQSAREIRHSPLTSQIWFFSTESATLFRASDAFTRSDSEWAAETNSLIPTGKRHLSSVDLLDATARIEWSFNNCKTATNIFKKENPAEIDSA